LASLAARANLSISVDDLLNFSVLELLNSFLPLSSMRFTLLPFICVLMLSLTGVLKGEEILTSAELDKAKE
jgi:hypothetical protein